MRAGVDAKATNAWDAEYAAGRYDDELPVAFVNDIIVAAKRIGVDHGVYIGCGNGRSYVPPDRCGAGPDRPRHLGNGDLPAG
jgi:hypothetical protein